MKSRGGRGRTFQVPRIFRQLTLLDNLDVAQQQTGRSADERYAQSEYWLRKVELHRLRHNYAEELSGGQQKLVELARIMVARPKVVLLDEPFAGVNPALAQLLISVIRELPVEHDCSVVLVSHDLTSIYQLSHHIIVMNEGAILTEGDAAMCGTIREWSRHISASRAHPQRLRPQGCRYGPAGDPCGLAEGAASIERGACVMGAGGLSRMRGTGLGRGRCLVGLIGLNCARRRGATDMSNAVLALEDVTVAYHGDITILNRVNVQARQGKVTGVIGPNGAGKSTVLKTLFGFLPPRTGRITLRGQDISAQPSHERARHGVAFVPQHRSLFGELSVHDNRLLGCWPFRQDKARVRRRIESVYERFPIPGAEARRSGVQHERRPAAFRGVWPRAPDRALGDPWTNRPPCWRRGSPRKSMR